MKHSTFNLASILFSAYYVFLLEAPSVRDSETSNTGEDVARHTEDRRTKR
jgi:hypothetical protein